MNKKLEFWYDQFLAKPPGKSVPTDWHQDEGYWGRNLDDRGITCWIPLQDVTAENGCMHFIDRGHLDGVLTHRSVDGVQSDLLTCDVDEKRMVVCPIKRGSVTFHHSKTPHMTTANTSKAWRKAVTNHMQEEGAGGEGRHYPWKIYVNQRTGERIIPERA
jgi:ectoine hydroxylase-related dioxygenase (phytanoyl-CoA dioxygenase family)